jgi:hypothetical protein
VGADGRPIRYGRLIQGVCLAQKEFLDQREQELEAGVCGLEPAGIWLDYLTYAGWFETPAPDLQESCFCPACVAEFCNAAGVDAEAPAEILARHRPAWMQHKCERIAGIGRRYAQIIRRHHPGCVVGAYMCPWTPDEFDGALQRIFGQDYSLLAPFIDVFTPLIYAQKCGRQPDWGCQFLENAHRFVPAGHKVQLILDVLDFPDSLLATASASRPSWGLQLFGGADVFADPDKRRVFQRAVAKIGAAVPDRATASQGT